MKNNKFPIIGVIFIWLSSIVITIASQKALSDNKVRQRVAEYFGNNTWSEQVIKYIETGDSSLLYTSIHSNIYNPNEVYDYEVNCTNAVIPLYYITILKDCSGGDCDYVTSFEDCSIGEVDSILAMYKLKWNHRLI